MKFAACLAATAIVAGCTAAEFNSINRPFNPTDGDSRLIDAKQRAIIAVEKPVINRGGGYEKGAGGKPIAVSPTVCAEPSPDVLQATATTLAANGALSQPNVTAVLNAAVGSSDGSRSFGLRTQSIQLLRDSYYRLCEAYLNDGIDSIAYDVLQRRFQNQIIALLAVEQLTGAVVGAQGSATAGTTADSGENAGLLAGQVQRQQGNFQAAVAARQQVFDAIQASDRRAGEIRADIARLEGEADSIVAVTGEPEEQAANREARARIQTQIDIRRTELETEADLKETLETELPLRDRDVQEQERMLAAIQEAFGEAETETAKATSLTSAAGGSAKANKESQNEAVVSAVRAITLNAMNQDYEAQVCFEALRVHNYVNERKNDTKKNVGDVFLNYCNNLFLARVEREREANNLLRIRGEVTQLGVRSAVTGKSRFTTEQLRDLLIAIDAAAPVDETGRFLKPEYAFPTE